MTFLLAASIFLSKQTYTFEGRYEGVLHIPNQDQKFVVDLGRDKTGTPVGSIILPGLFVKGAAIEKLSISDGKLSFDVSNVLGGIHVEGALHNNDLEGTFKQGGNSTDLHLWKTGPAQVDFPAAQRAFSDDVIGTWKGDYTFKYLRHVTLTLKNENGVPKVTWVVVGKRTTNIPVDFASDVNGYMILTSSTFVITIEGTHRAGSDICKAYLSLDGLDLPLVLHKVKEGK